MSSNWKETTLGEVANIVDCPHSTPVWTPKGYFVVRNYNLSNGRISKENPSYTDEQTYLARIKRAKPQKGDIILSREAPIGSLGLIRDEGDICLGQRVVLIQPQQCDSEFLLYEMLSPLIQNEFKIAQSSGSVVSNFRIPQIKALSIFLPSHSEQRAIAEILSSLDDKIELLRRENQTLEAIAQTLFKEWFVHFTVEGKKLKMNSKTGLPEGWRMGRLGEIIELAYGKALKEEERSGSGYPVIGSSGIVGYHNDYLVNGMGIVVGRKGSMGTVIWVEDNFYPIDTTFFVIDKIGTKKLFFHLFVLKNINFQRIGSDSAVPGLNKNMASSLETIIPHYNSILSYNDTVESLFSEMRNNNSQIQTLSKLRDTLLPKLMKGEIRISEMEKSDE